MTTNDINLPTWCLLRAERFRDYEQREMAMYPDSDNRDMAIVEWTVRCLANPLTDGSRDALALIAGQHDAELNPTGTADWLKNRVNELTAELTLTRDQRDAARSIADELRDDLRAADESNANLQQHIADIRNGAF